MTDSSH